MAAAGQSSSKAASSIKSILPALALAASSMAITAIFSARMHQIDLTQIAFGMLLSGIAVFAFERREQVIKNLYSKKDKPMLLISAFLSIIITANNALFFQSEWTGSAIYPSLPHRYALLTAAAILGGICGFFAVFTAVYAFVLWFRRLAADFISKADKYEKYCFIIAGSVLSLIIITVFSITNIFYAPTDGGGFIPYDVVFTSDSPTLVKYDTYLNICSEQNDLRQPLFGIFAAPFAAAAKALSLLLFFIPNIYVILLGIMQALLLIITNIMVVRLLGLKGGSKALFLGVTSVIYPALLYTLCMEQYIFSVFWLIAFIYISLCTQEDNRLPFIGAAGSLLTTGVLFPLLILKGTVKERILTLFKTLAAFAAFIFASGGAVIVFGAVSYLGESLVEFTGEKLTFYEKLLQFINFAATCFAAPAAEIRTLSGSTFLSWQMQAVDSVNIAGVAIIALAALGFALNFKDTFARICACWAAFSFVMLCLLGWGTAENGLVLYSLYFAWAYLGLIAMLIEKLFARVPAVKYVIYAAVITALLAVNLPAMLELIRFGAETYPV